MDCKSGNIAIISRIKGLLAQIEDCDYSKPLEVLGGASLGQHFRHILDFYHCLLRDMPTGAVDYTKRERNPAMETAPGAAAAAFEQVTTSLLAVEESGLLRVMGDFSASDGLMDRPALLSSAGRELMYAHDHAVHHLAIIRIGLKEAAPAVVFDPDLGYAPATVQFREQRA